MTSSLSFDVSSPTAVMRSSLRRTLPTTAPDPVPSIMRALIISVSASKAGEAVKHSAPNATVAVCRSAFKRERHIAPIKSLNLRLSLCPELNVTLWGSRTHGVCSSQAKSVQHGLLCDPLTARWVVLRRDDQNSPGGNCWYQIPWHSPALNAYLRARRPAQ